MRTITISSQGDIPTAHVIIGHAQFGKFAINLFNTNQTFIRRIALSSTPQSDAEFFNIDASSALDGKILGWDTVTAPFTSSPGQFFSITMEIRQNGLVVAAFTDEGAFSGGKPKLTRAESATFNVV
jgi:hypothetical protein